MQETKNETKVERVSDLELVVTRTVSAPAHFVFEAWTNPDLFRKWWVPKSYGLNLVACDMDVQPGGQYRLAFLHEGATMEFFGTYIEVTLTTRLVWTNDEGDAGQTITTVTFEEKDGKTVVVVHDLYPTKDSVDNGSTGAMPEVLQQLEDLLASLGSGSDAD